jgi:hypothetical protein
VFFPRGLIDEMLRDRVAKWEDDSCSDEASQIAQLQLHIYIADVYEGAWLPAVPI